MNESRKSEMTQKLHDLFEKIDPLAKEGSQAIKLEEFLTGIKEEAFLRNKEKHFYILEIIDQQLPDSLKFDGHTVKLILEKLISNALKNMKESSSICIEVSYNWDMHQLHFNVSDDAHKIVSKRAYQVEKKSVESLGGQFFIQDSPNAGNQIRFWIPAIEPELFRSFS